MIWRRRTIGFIKRFCKKSLRWMGVRIAYFADDVVLLEELSEELKERLKISLKIVFVLLE